MERSQFILIKSRSLSETGVITMENATSLLICLVVTNGCVSKYYIHVCCFLLSLGIIAKYDPGMCTVLKLSDSQVYVMLARFG